MQIKLANKKFYSTKIFSFLHHWLSILDVFFLDIWFIILQTCNLCSTKIQHPSTM
jgi:hypothetical protein